MAAKLKKLSEQVIVITGASSGIGLATAEAAAVGLLSGDRYGSGPPIYVCSHSYAADGR